MDGNDFQMPVDFALFEGGPLHPVWRRFGFVKPGMAWLDGRIILISVIAWLPLLVLSLWEGYAWSGTGVPFLHDLEAQARFVLVLPLLLVGERHADRVLKPALGTFIERGIIQEGDRARFKRILTSTAGWNRSPVVLILLIGVVLVAGRFIWQEGVITRAGSWYRASPDAGLRLTFAGYWYAWVSIPVFQFIVYRWYLRLLFWWSLLSRVSWLDLHLVATHPDHAGGIGFLGNKLYAFVPFLLSQGVMVSGIFSNRIFCEQRHLQEFSLEFAVFAGFVVILVLGPMAVFSRPLIFAKRRGRSEFSLFAFRYVEEFERKWMRGGASPTEALGSPDIQSLADLANAFEVVKKMRAVPFGRTAILKVVVPFALPIAPLLLTVFPVEKVLLTLLKMLL